MVYVCVLVGVGGWGGGRSRGGGGSGELHQNIVLFLLILMHPQQNYNISHWLMVIIFLPYSVLISRLLHISLPIQVILYQNPSITIPHCHMKCTGSKFDLALRPLKVNLGSSFERTW